MSGKRNYNEPDDFSDLIKQKLEYHKIPVDAECWDEIEFRLKPRKRHIMRWVGGVAAAVAIVLFSLYFLSEDDVSLKGLAYDNIGVSEVKKQEQRETVKREAEPVGQVKTATVHSAAPKLIAGGQEKVEPSGLIKDIQAVMDTVVIPDNGILMAGQDENTPVAEPDSAIQPENKQEVKLAKLHHEPKKILLPPKDKKRDSWLLAASFSSGNSNTVGSGGDAQMQSMLRYSPDNAVDSYPAFLETAKVLSLDEFSDVDHSMPITFGLTVRKDINDRFGVETGLMYTYLSSRFKKNGESHYRTKQELHYLGVPLNLVVYLWNDQKWNIYITTGGMVEKGLRANYTQNVYQNNSKIGDTSEKSSIDGLQWSLNASIGASYTFYQGLGLYFEPRVSYYFDNGQPVSIRTEKNTVFGLSGGLRYKF